MKKNYFHSLRSKVLFVLTYFIFAPMAMAQDCKPPECYPVENQLPAARDLPTAIGLVARIFIGICGSLALVMFVYGGFLWLTSGGNTEKIDKGKKIFVWSAIGLAIIFGAYAIISQVFRTLGA